MLRFLSIQRLAVVDSLEIEFDRGFSVLTGETGAGKSIVVEAVDLLMGGRASADLVRTGAEAALVQAEIETADGQTVAIRREVTAQGRSRGFINGDLVTATGLKETVGALIDLHGQHEHQALLAPGAQRAALDGFGGWQTQLETVAERFDRFETARRELDAAVTSERDRDARLELLDFQLQAIDKVDPKLGEDDELSTEKRVLANAERMHRLCTESYQALYEGDGAVLDVLSGVWRRLEELAQFDPQFGAYLALKDSVRAPLDDISLFVRSYASRLDASPDRLQTVENRLAEIERVKRRHGPTLADVLSRHESLRKERQQLATATERASELRLELEVARQAYLDAARALTELRTETSARFSRALEHELAELAMEKTRCQFTVVPSTDDVAGWGREGIDSVDLLISPNPGEALRPLARIASGGELSRVMLAIRSVSAPDAPGKTLIFDEVDAGIGGRAADAVGARLRSLGERFQVLCVTHLPQVAAHASRHFVVTKEAAKGRTRAVVRCLQQKERVDEIARMIGGSDVTPKVLAGAQEMLATRQTVRREDESERRKRKDA